MKTNNDIRVLAESFRTGEANCRVLEALENFSLKKKRM